MSRFNHLARWVIICVVVLLVLAAVVSNRRSAVPSLPVIPVANLDPAVAALIESTLAEVRATPRSSQGWGKLGSVLMHYEFVEQARAAFLQAQHLDPKNPRWPYLNGLLLLPYDYGQALHEIRKSVELAGRQADTPRLLLANTLMEHAAFTEAADHFQILLQSTTNYPPPPAWLGLARVRLAEGSAAECTNYLTHCLSDPHTSKAAYALLAQAEQALTNSAAASLAARQSRLLPADEPWPDPFWEEAIAYRVGLKAMLQDASDWLDQGHLEQALATLSQATRLYPTDAESWYLMGWAFNRAQRSVEAEGVLGEHLRRAHDSPKGLAQLGVALLGQKRYEEAIPILEQAAKLKPTWREPQFNLGFAFHQLGREAEAINHLRQALALDPSYVATYKALAELLNRRGEREEAQRLLEQAKEL